MDCRDTIGTIRHCRHPADGGTESQNLIVQLHFASHRSNPQPQDARSEHNTRATRLDGPGTSCCCAARAPMMASCKGRSEMVNVSMSLRGRDSALEQRQIGKQPCPSRSRKICTRRSDLLVILFRACSLPQDKGQKHHARQVRTPQFDKQTRKTICEENPMNGDDLCQPNFRCQGLIWLCGKEHKRTGGMQTSDATSHQNLSGPCMLHCEIGPAAKTAFEEPCNSVCSLRRDVCVQHSSRYPYAKRC